MIGLRLKTARFHAGLTQSELGIRAGIDEESASSRISHYENEIHSPDFSLVKRLAKVLDVPTAYFYTEDDELADFIIQYHKLKKQKPDAFLGLTVS
ncbi:helix-turn-helix transcriptional regulator [Orbaceae bacterium ESL0721]|nr:helix-turn-helix transcriptional regulator [Orbaceae bacterium ESL0721]